MDFFHHHHSVLLLLISFFLYLSNAQDVIVETSTSPGVSWYLPGTHNTPQLYPAWSGDTVCYVCDGIYQYELVPISYLIQQGGPSQSRQVLFLDFCNGGPRCTSTFPSSGLISYSFFVDGVCTVYSYPVQSGSGGSSGSGSGTQPANLTNWVAPTQWYEGNFLGIPNQTLHFLSPAYGGYNPPSNDAPSQYFDITLVCPTDEPDLGAGYFNYNQNTSEIVARLPYAPMCRDFKTCMQFSSSYCLMFLHVPNLLSPLLSSQLIFSAA
jgi:hypothetical protein